MARARSAPTRTRPRDRCDYDRRLAPRQPSDDAAKDDPADDARTPQSAFASRSRGVSPAIRRIKLSPQRR